MDREKVIDWIQKLMTKAMDPGSTPAEQAALQEKVAHLMAKYKISEMEAVTPEEIKDHEMIREEARFYQGNQRGMNWGNYLAGGIAPIFECKSLRMTGTNRIMFFGYPQDVATVTFLFRHFQLQIVEFADRTNYTTVKDKNSYAHGMVLRITERVGAAYKRAKEIVPSSCRDLIVLKEGAVLSFRDKELAEMGMRLAGKSNHRPQMNGNAYTQGYVDGQRVDISNPYLDKLQN